MQIIEHYLSIQGEGLRSGKLTYFVRFARCNLRCAWCDSVYTFGKGQKIHTETILNAIEKSGAPFICLTGGEPLLHPEDCLELIRSFPNRHFDIETGGSLDIAPFQARNTSIIMDWKLAHSGMNHKMKEDNLRLLRKDFDLLKFVTDASDLEKSEILEIALKTETQEFPISIQPVFGAAPHTLTDWMIGLKNPRFQINLQIHKYIWSKVQTGV